MSGQQRFAAGVVAASAFLWLLAPSQVADAGPNDGEARPITRDADRVYTTVAGEPDGAATVTNPANLAFLRGVNGIVDLSWTRGASRRRGSGVGALLGVPLPWRIGALGFAYQFLYPKTPGVVVTDGSAQPQNPDDSYSKVTFALSASLQRWVKPVWLQNLSFGLSYSRLISSQNFHAARTNQLDLAVAWWPSRFAALGIVARGINLPVTGPDFARVTQSYVFDPEIAVRPLGTNALELAIGSRFAAGVPRDARFRTHVVDPRGRVLLNVRGVRVFAEAERFRYFPDLTGGAAAASRDAVRITAGLGLDFGHFGAAVGLTGSGRGTSALGVDGAVARLRLSQERYDSVIVTRPRIVTRLALSDYSGDRGMWTLIGHLDRLAQAHATVLIDTQGLALQWAQLEEVREALLRLRASGGKVVAYLGGGALRSYFVAAVADRIIAHPNSAVEILGMRMQSFYYADLLGKLGVKAEFVRIAEYKGAVDTWERRGASDPVARQRRQLFSDLWNHALRTIGRDRGQDPMVVKDWIDQAPLVPSTALQEGVVDELAYPDELDARLEGWLGREVRIADLDRQREHAKSFGPGPRIAVLHVEGDLIQGESLTIPLLGRKLAGDRTLVKVIEALGKDPGVRAVVVRIDSPGGNVGAADRIARALDQLRAYKPVVISMGNTCASGGYYIATAGQYVFSDAMTVTGSIGIFYPKFDLSGLADKIGLGIDHLDFGDHAGMRSNWKPYTPEEREAAQRTIAAHYDHFVDRVAQARNMTTEQVDSLARGRVWSGVRAQEVGLVDAYGGLREAVSRARVMAGLTASAAEVIIVPPTPGILANLRALFGVKIPTLLGREFGAEPAALGPGFSLSPIWLRALGQLPASLWLVSQPEAMALSEMGVSIDD